MRAREKKLCLWGWASEELNYANVVTEGSRVIQRQEGREKVRERERKGEKEEERERGRAREERRAAESDWERESQGENS